MSSKQIKLLCTILGCVSLVCIAGALYAGYRYVDIVKDYGIDAPFEDFTNNPYLVNALYNIGYMVKNICKYTHIAILP
jgi:hypothetical protein